MAGEILDYFLVCLCTRTPASEIQALLTGSHIMKVDGLPVHDIIAVIRLGVALEGLNSTSQSAL
jgi:hypothetical protein